MRRNDGRRAPDRRDGGSSSSRSDRPNRFSSDRSSGPRSYSRPARGGDRPFRGGASRGGDRGSSSFSRPARGNRNYQEMSVDLSKLVNKAKPGEVVEAYVPKHQFIDFPVDQRLKDNIIAKGYVTPTPIQDQSIPVVLEGKDIVGIAQTGTGKTAAFLLPLIDKVLKMRAAGIEERVLIMVPTRELAIQIEQEFYGFARQLGINSVVVVGGAGMEPQVRGLRRKPNFVIGTPGRLKDLMERRELDLSHFKTVVLDEADRMLDMGFIQDMRHIMSFMEDDRHTLFFSATLSRDIEKLIGEFLNNPVRIMVKTRDTASTVDQDVIRVQNGQKLETLIELLKQPEFDKVIVFGRTKHGVERLARDLNVAGIKSDSIHGDKTHGKRQKALGLFKQNHVNVLVATDVAARGLDISGVSHVINFDLPATYEDYTHRIGRTGRAGKTGVALTFI
jgi:ATP-dependent RNA helicase RhlE